MRKLAFGIRNTLSTGSTLELMFLDEIQDGINWDTWTWTNMVEEVISKIKAAAPKTIKCTINSYGGDCVIGLSIYNFLKSYAAEVEVEIVGICGSIATVIASAADAGKLKIARNAFFVIHQAWGLGVGNSTDLRNAADVVDKFTDTIVDVYSQRNGMKADDIRALIPAGTDYWMSGQEAVDQKFCDALLADNGQFQIAACIKGLQGAGYKNIPANVLNSLGKPAEEQDPNPSILQSLYMKFTELLDGFTNSLKTSKIDNNAKNLAEEVANVMSGPMATLMEGMQKQVEDDIKGIEANVTKTVGDKYEARIKGLEDAKAELEKSNGELKAENKKLSEDVAAKLGGESTSGNDPKNDIKPLGSGVKANA